MSAEQVVAETKLYFREGASDKVYDVQLVCLDPKPPTIWRVTFAYGRRGKLPLRGIKLERGGYFTAKDAYEKLVRAKMDGHGCKLASGPTRLPASGVAFDLGPADPERLTRPTTKSKIIAAVAEPARRRFTFDDEEN